MPLEKLNQVRAIMNLYGTSSPTEIQRHLKADGIKMSRRSIFDYIRKIKASNEEWLDGQGKTNWMNKIRELYEEKCQRLIQIKKDWAECTQPRTKAYYAEVIDSTEKNLVEFMESQPMYYLWNKWHKEDDGVTYEENAVHIED